MGTTKARYIELYGEAAWDIEAKKRKEKARINYIEHKEQYRERFKKWCNNNAERKKQYDKEYRKNNKEKITKNQQKYKINNKEKLAKKSNDYRKTIRGRAANLLHGYRQIDSNFNRGECTLTHQWIIDNIFASKCIYCGDSDWTHLGADRIDNSKPHTPENCVCACTICNLDRQDRYTVEEFKEYRKTHPRELGKCNQKSWEIVEMKGIKVLKKRAI